MLQDRRGFSLVELLIVIVIMGMVITAVLGLYVNVGKSTDSSEEVVEVQQSLRVALDRISRDLLMCGFLVPVNNPIQTAGDGTLQMQTASISHTAARVSAAATFPSGSSGSLTISIADGDMVRNFGNGNYVRIISPMDGCQPAESTPGSCGDGDTPFFMVTSTNTSSTPPTITLRPKTVAGGNIQDYAPASAIGVLAGDMIVQVQSPADDPTYPNLITYSILNDGTNSHLIRDVTPAIGETTAQQIGYSLTDKVTDLQFEYLMDDGSVEPVAPATAVAADRRDNIVAVRVTITGETDPLPGETAKERQIQSTIKLRNN